MAEIKQTERAANILHIAMDYCKEYRHEFILPEHLLLAMSHDADFVNSLNIFYQPDVLSEQLSEKLDEIESVPNYDWWPR